MENFFYDDEFYSEVGDLLNHLDIEEDKLHELQEDWQIECVESDLQPIITLSADWIHERISENRFTENGNESEELYRILEQYIPFDKINSLIPKLYYPTRKKFTITKQDLINY